MVGITVKETPTQTFYFCISVVIETCENRVLSIRATDYSPKMVCDNLENKTTSKLQTLPLLKSDNNRNCRLQWPIKIELLKRIIAALLKCRGYLAYTPRRRCKFQFPAGALQLSQLPIISLYPSFSPFHSLNLSFLFIFCIHHFQLSFQSFKSTLRPHIFSIHASFPLLLSIHLSINFILSTLPVHPSFPSILLRLVKCGVGKYRNGTLHCP